MSIKNNSFSVAVQTYELFGTVRHNTKPRDLTRNPARPFKEFASMPIVKLHRLLKMKVIKEMRSELDSAAR